ncbi:hypothetical protein DIRU0_E42912 [Diutina rugosa]
MTSNQDDDLGWLVGPSGAGDVDVVMDDNLAWAAAIPGAYNADPPLTNPMDLDQSPFDIDPAMVSEMSSFTPEWTQPVAPAVPPMPPHGSISGDLPESQINTNDLFTQPFDYNFPHQIQRDDHGHRSLFRKFQNDTTESPQPLTVSARSPDNNSDISHLDDPSQALHHELSPLTTTTSHTPSLSSMHSAQPSFFSAQQYFSRNSMETGSLAGSTNEYFARPSLDSGKSVRSFNGGPMSRYQSFSFSNIIPFMGERNQQQQPSEEFFSQPVMPPEQLNQQRHSIRNIFNKAPPPAQSQPPEEDLAMVDIANVDDSKVKKPKRSIFMRFKASNAATKEGAPSEEVIDEEDEPMVTECESNEAPDYGALFENVLKRKGKPSKPRKTDEGSGGDVSEQHSLHEAVTNASGSSVGQQSQNTHGSGPAPTSAAASVISGESYEDAIPQPEGAFAAGKRILGAKLINRKKAVPPNVSNGAAVTLIDGFSVAPTANGKPVATMISKGVEVEVDLKSLDLPPDTQIFPTNVINQKNRTRGRKENKEADLADASKVYLCNYCSRRFKRQEHLKRHFRSLHTFEKPYDCPMCHKKFSRQDNLNQHLKTHKGDNADEDNVIEE